MLVYHLTVKVCMNLQRKETLNQRQRHPITPQAILWRHPCNPLGYPSKFHAKFHIDKYPTLQHKYIYVYIYKYIYIYYIHIYNIYIYIIYTYIYIYILPASMLFMDGMKSTCLRQALNKKKYSRSKRKRQKTEGSTQ